MTYLLTTGGHNAGIVAPPGEPGHSYRVKTEVAHATYTGPDEWLRTVPSVEGSWWRGVDKWLAARSGEPSEPPRMGEKFRGGQSARRARRLRSSLTSSLFQSRSCHRSETVRDYHAAPRTHCVGYLYRDRDLRGFITDVDLSSEKPALPAFRRAGRRSPRHGSVGRAILDNIRKAQFKGEFGLVNPRYPEIDGVATVGSIQELAFAPELVVLNHTCPIDRGTRR